MLGPWSAKVYELGWLWRCSCLICAFYICTTPQEIRLLSQYGSSFEACRVCPPVEPGQGLRVYACVMRVFGGGPTRHGISSSTCMAKGHGRSNRGRLRVGDMAGRQGWLWHPTLAGQRCLRKRRGSKYIGTDIDFRGRGSRLGAEQGERVAWQPIVAFGERADANLFCAASCLVRGQLHAPCAGGQAGHAGCKIVAHEASCGSPLRHATATRMAQVEHSDNSSEAVGVLVLPAWARSRALEQAESTARVD